MGTNARKEDIEALKAAIETATGMHFISSGQFETLRNIVFSRTGEYVSPTTLKRLWGYIDEPTNTRLTTLTFLAKTLGYANWQDFLSREERGSEARTPSLQTLTDNINVATDLNKGDVVALYWYPGRECIVRYLGDMKFEVLKSEKTRLQPGYTFTANVIISGQPLHLSNLSKDGSAPVAYICGRLHGGVSYRRMTDKDL